MEPKAELVFEVSWEVCNKVGGIFTVVQSKISPVKEYYGDNYFLIGPYFPKKAFGIFEERVPPTECRAEFDELKREGIEVHCGTWITKGNPNVFLIDFTGFTAKKDEIKRNLWDWYKIDSLYTEYFDFDEPVIWAYAVGRLIEALAKIFKDKRIVAHFHEWLAGAGLLYLMHNGVRVGTVFTTHATTLGRSIAMQERNLYEEMETIDADSEAKKFGSGTFAKHLAEKQSALNAHVFTTVSEITAIEAEKFLGRKPDFVLPNGLDMSKFPSFEEASFKHKLFKSRIKQFIMYYFFPYYKFNIDDTLIYFLAGRYEFHDKGIDIFIKALAGLNERLKKENCEKTIIAFFWIPGNVKGIRSELLESKTQFLDIKDGLDDIHEDIHNELLHMLIGEVEISKETLFTEDFLQELKPKIMRLKKKGLPPLTTHELYNEEQDLIMKALREAGLTNKAEDRVKVVFYPIYLTGADGLLDTSYYESMQGSHLGVFPSYYEPWGYTPLEAAALAVSSVTTDLAGFGRYLLAMRRQGKYPGVFVLPRYKKSDEEIIGSLIDFMHKFAHFTHKERIENKIMAQKIAATADWKYFITHYIEAHNRAIQALG